MPSRHDVPIAADSSSCCNWHIDMRGKGERLQQHSRFPLQALVLQAHVFLRACVFRQDCDCESWPPPHTVNSKQHLGTSSVLPGPLGKPTGYGIYFCYHHRPVWQCGGAPVTWMTFESQFQFSKCFLQVACETLFSHLPLILPPTP